MPSGLRVQLPPPAPIKHLSITVQEPPNKHMLDKRANLEKLKARGLDMYPNDFRPTHTAAELRAGTVRGPVLVYCLYCGEPFVLSLDKFNGLQGGVKTFEGRVCSELCAVELMWECWQAVGCKETSPYRHPANDDRLKAMDAENNKKPEPPKPQ